VTYTAADYKSVTAANWSFTVPVSSTNDGKWKFSITAEDAADHTSTSTVMVTMDSTSPVLVITNPETADLSFVNSAYTAAVSGTVTEKNISGVYYKLSEGSTGETDYSAGTDWRAASVSGTSWTAPINWSGNLNKEYTVSIAAEDAAGNITVCPTTPHLYPDSSAPVIQGDSEADSISVKDASNEIVSLTNSDVTVSGIIKEANLSDFYVTASLNGNAVNGTEIGVTTTASALLGTAVDNRLITFAADTYSGGTGLLSDKVWSLTVPATKVFTGNWSFTVYAQDTAGHTSLKTASVIIDKTGPSITVNNLNSGSTVYESNSSYTTASETYSLSLQLNDTYSTPENRIYYSWASADSCTSIAAIASGFAAIPVTEGNNETLYLKAKDSLSNESDAVIITGLTFDKQQPVISVSGDTTNTGSDNASLMVSVTDTNPQEPTVTAYSPAGNSIESAAALSKESVEQDKTTWSVSISVDKFSEDGIYTVKVNDTDTNGRSADEVSHTIFYDANPPSASITTPAADAYIDTSSYQFRGAASDGNLDTVKVTLDGGEPETVTPDASGIWTLTKYGLSETNHTVSVTARDKAANQTVVGPVAFTIDTTVPATTVNVTDGSVNKADGTNAETVFFGSVYYAKAGFSLGGTLSETNFATAVLRVCKDNGTAQEIAADKWTAPTADGSSWSYSQTAAADHSDDGTYVYSIALTDKAGNVTTESITVCMDTINPTIEITTPGKGTSVAAEMCTIKGSAADDSAGLKSKMVRYQLDTGSGYSGTWTNIALNGTNWSIDSADLGTSKGEKKLKMQATDNAGNLSAETEVVFYYDTAEPVLDETAINTGDVHYLRNDDSATVDTDESSCTFGGSVSDDWQLAAVTVSINSGTAIEITPSAGKWTYVFGIANGDSPRADGTYALVFTATDRAGKSSTVTRTVMIDTHAPAFGTGTDSDNHIPYIKTKGTEISDTVWYNTTSLTVAGTASDSGSGLVSVEYSLDNENWASLAGTASWEGTISSITNGGAIYLRLADRAGNINTASITDLHIDVSAPTVTVTSPEGTKLVNGRNDVEVSGTDSDAESGVASVILLIGSRTADADHRVTATVAGNTWTADIPAATITNGTVWARVTDKVGNEYESSLFMFQLDDTAPTVTFSNISDADSGTAGTQVNGTVTIAGTTSDDQSLKTVELQYSTDTANWTTLQTFRNGPYSWAANVDSVTAFGSISDGTTVYLRAVATDDAGNSNVPAAGNSDYIPVIVNQDTDRPVIKIANLDLSGMTSSNSVWLTGTKTLYGTVTDDDGTSGLSMAIRYKFKSAEDFSDSEVVPVSSGSWSYSLPEGDGSYVLEFSVKDAKGTTFTSAAAETSVLQSTMKITDGTHTFGTSSSDSDTFAYIKEDMAAPDISIDGISADDGDSWTTSGYSSITLGGAVHDVNGTSVSSTKTFQLKGVATDANSIKSIKLVTSGLTDVAEQTLTAIPDNDGTYLFTDILCSDGTGTMTITVTATDNASNEKSQTLNLSVDNTVPAVTTLNPSSSTTSSGKVTAYGSIDESPRALYYAVSVSGTQSPDDNDTALTSWTEGDDDSGTTSSLLDGKSGRSVYTEIKDASFSWYVYFDGDTDSSLTTTHSELLNTYLVDLGVTTQSALEDSSFTSVVKLYIWIKAVDEAGNSTEKPQLVLLDPQGGRPKVTIDYPEVNGISLGGTVRLSGSATDDGSVNAVFVQLLSTAHTYSGYAERSSASYGIVDTDAYTTAVPTESDLDYMASIGTVYKISTYKPTDAAHDTWKMGTSTFSGSSTDGTDWGLLTSFSGSSWSLNVNKNGELDPETGTNAVGIRIYATDTDTRPTKSVAVDRIVSFDADTPVISDLYLVQSDDILYDTARTASREYTDDMWVKGNWYLTGTATDDDSIKTLTIDGNELVSEESIQSSSAWSVVQSGDKKTVRFKYRLDTGTGVGNLLFIVTAEDNATPTSHTTAPKSISVNYDNTAPNLIISGSGYTIDPKVQQSNNFYTFGSQVTESAVDGNQSGFARTAFYFLRRDLTADTAADYTYTVFDPMISTDTGGNAVSIKSAISAADVDTGTADGTVVYKSGLYWKYKKLDTRDATNLSSLTLTEPDSNIHPGGLVEIGNAIYTIKSADDTSVTIDGSPEPTYTTAYFALALVVDNTVTESSSGILQTDSGYGYGYGTPLNDDGDRMIEGVTKSGTTWTWEANICSRNIPDGPVEIHYVVFDAAGNYSIGTSGNVGKSVYGGGTAGYTTQEVRDADNDFYVYDSYTYTADTPAFVSNNAPRIAGVQVGTDRNNNRIIDDDEWNALNSAAALSYRYVSAGIYDVDKLGTSIELGSSTTPLLTAKGYTEIKPEIVGGNGKIYYSYRYPGGTNTTVSGSNKKKSLGSGTTDYSLDTLSSINMQIGDLLKAGTTGDTLGMSDNIPFTFKIWDSTAATRICDNSQHADITVHMGVNLKNVTPPSAIITPFYWTGISDNSLYANSKDNGHIELEDDLPETTFTTGRTGEYDRDPKVSGQIVITGFAHDNRQLSALYVSVPGMENSLNDLVTSPDTVRIPPTETVNGVTYYLIAVCTNGTWSGADAFSDKGIKFEVGTNTYDAGGQTAPWKFSWDTSKITDSVATDVKVQILALNKGIPSCGTASSSDYPSIDGTTYYAEPLYSDNENSGYSTKQTSGTSTDGSLTSLYRMDVVPYITEIHRNSSYNTNRSRSGAYPLLRGEKANTLTGFNLGAEGTELTLIITRNSDGSGTKYTMESPSVTTANSTLTFTMPSDAKDGYLGISVNSVTSLNNLDKDSSLYNSEAVSNVDDTTYWTNDRYVHVWQSNEDDYFAGSSTPIYPAMAMNPSTGDLYASWSNYSDAEVYRSKLGDDDSTTRVFFAYDPPEETDISVDNTGQVNVFYSANYQGGNGDSDWVSGITHAGGVYLYDDSAPSLTVKSGSDHIYRFELFYHDRMLQQFKNLRVARGTDDGYIHVAYYDRLSNSVKYADVKDGQAFPDSTNFGNSTNFELPWIRIDGGSDDEDTASLSYTYGSWPYQTTSTGTCSVVSQFDDGLSVSAGTGETVALAVDDDNYPVLVYIDADTGTLRLARSNKNSPMSASDWTVQSVLSTHDANYNLVSDYVAAKVDSSGFIHIIFENTKNQLIYVKSTNNPENGAAYTFGDSAVIDDSGMWADLTLHGTTPYISYMSRINSYDSIKLAYYDSALDLARDGSAAGGWETMTAPLDKKATNVRTCIEAQPDPASASWEAAVGFTPGDLYRVAYYIGTGAGH
jgi:hypothetical protein